MTIALIGVGILLILLIMGMNIGICMMAVGFFGFWYVRGLGPALTLFRQIPFTQATTYSFTVIPLFVLMGNLCFYSGMSADLFETAHKWLGGMKGGLAAATVAACAAFSAICGSVFGATAAGDTIAVRRPIGTASA